MTRELIDSLSPIIVQLVATAIVILLTRYLLPALQTYVGAQRLTILHTLAMEAYAFVEAQAPELTIEGEAKLAMAIAYLDARLAERGIPITMDQMRAAIEDVWLQYNVSD